MVNDGKGVYQIADILSEEKVLCPSAYLAAKGVGNRRNSKFEDPYRWWGTTVSYILARVEYMGHTVNFKTSRISLFWFPYLFFLGFGNIRAYIFFSYIIAIGLFPL